MFCTPMQMLAVVIRANNAANQANSKLNEMNRTLKAIASQGLDSGGAGRREIDRGRLPVSGRARPGGGARTWRRGEIFLRADRSVYRATLPAAAPVQGS